MFQRAKKKAWLRQSAFCAAEPLPDVLEIQENSKYLVDIAEGHKTGFYLDQRDNRRLLAELVKRYLAEYSGRAKLLNLFSYTGGFALAAGHFGALHSVNVDASRKALEMAERNFLYNGYEPATHGETAEFILADGFDYLRHCAQVDESFDFVVLDPPRFAGSKRQVERAGPRLQRPQPERLQAYQGRRLPDDLLMFRRN